MFRALLKVAALSLLTAVPAMAEDYTLAPRITMAPVVTGPSGYLAALNNGSDVHQFELVHLGGDMVAFRAPFAGYLRTGFTQWNYLSIEDGAIDDSARFILERSGNQASIRSVLTGLYVGFNPGSGRLRAAFPEQDEYTLWVMQRVGAATGEPEADTGFFEQRWRMTSYRDAQGRWVNRPQDMDGWMSIIPRQSGGETRVQIDTLCDSFNVGVSFRPPRMAFPSMQNTRAYCDDDRRAVSQGYLDALARTDHFDAAERRLRLLDANGEAVVILDR